jgi:hypothetical protein
MGSQKELEIGILFGETYCKFFKFIINEITKNAYLVIPHVMKLSIHPPNPPRFPSWHAHWKDYENIIHEDIDSQFFSPESLKQMANDFLHSFKPYPLTSDENVIALSPDLITNAYREEVVGNRERTTIDVGRTIKSFCRETFYNTKARRLPLLMKRLRRSNPNLLHDDLSIMGISQDRVIIPFNQDLMVGVEYRKLLENLSTGSGLLDSMQRGFEKISRLNPSAIQKLKPQGIEDFAQEIMNSLKLVEPKILNF